MLSTGGRTLISKTGGASGPLYGTAFRQAAKTLGEDADVSAPQLGAALQAALADIQQLGAAAEGDKTMVDALSPAVSAYQKVIDTGGVRVVPADGTDDGRLGTSTGRGRGPNGDCGDPARPEE